MNTTPYMYTTKQQEEIQDFINDNFGSGNGYIAHEITSEYVHTDTMIISPNGQTRSFVTFGMGARKMNSPIKFNRTELVMSASKDFDENAKEGFMVAGELCRISKYPFRDNTWIGPGHTIDTSTDFEERFGYQYFAFWDLELCADISGGIGDVNFLALVPLYEDEREWIVENNTNVYLSLLYEKFGDDIFNVDIKREHFIPDIELDEDEIAVAQIMQILGIDAETLNGLWEYLAEAEENGEEITDSMISEWLERNK